MKVLLLFLLLYAICETSVKSQTKIESKFNNVFYKQYYTDSFDQQDWDKIKSEYLIYNKDTYRAKELVASWQAL